MENFWANLKFNACGEIGVKPVEQQKSRLGTGHLPLNGKSALIVEDNALIALNLELCLLDAGATVVKIANSIASAKSALDEGIAFDVAVVDLLLPDGNASKLVQFLSGRGVGVVIATGDCDAVCQGQLAFRTAIDILQKPYTDRDLFKALTKCAAAAP